MHNNFDVSLPRTFTVFSVPGLGLTFWVTRFCKQRLIAQSGLKTGQLVSGLRPPFDSCIEWR